MLGLSETFASDWDATTIERGRCWASSVCRDWLFSSTGDATGSAFSPFFRFKEACCVSMEEFVCTEWGCSLGEPESALLVSDSSKP